MINSGESSIKLDFGLASNFAFLVWAIWGGFILYMLESNYLAVLMQPKFEKPINTIEDVLKSNLNALYKFEGFEKVLRESSNEKNNQLAEVIKVPETDGTKNFTDVMEEMHNSPRQVISASA